MQLFQVDERIAPAGDPDRNIAMLAPLLTGVELGGFFPMPVEAVDLDRAGAPDDPILDVVDADVAITDRHQGRQRMSLTRPVLGACGRTALAGRGASKFDALGKLMAGDPSIPATMFGRDQALILADRAAVTGE